MEDYVNSSRTPFQNWFYFINRNHGIFSALEQTGIYSNLIERFKKMDDQSKEDQYVELLKPIGVALYRKQSLVFDYASALMSVNFLKLIFKDANIVADMLTKIASQRANISIEERDFKGKKDKTYYCMIGAPQCQAHRVLGKLPTETGSLVGWDHRLMRYGYRKGLNEDAVKRQNFIKYYMVWRDYDDCLKDYVQNHPNEPLTVVRNKFNKELLKFRFPTSEETYHHFEHIIL